MISSLVPSPAHLINKACRSGRLVRDEWQSTADTVIAALDDPPKWILYLATADTVEEACDATGFQLFDEEMQMNFSGADLCGFSMAAYLKDRISLRRFMHQLMTEGTAEYGTMQPDHEILEVAWADLEKHSLSAQILQEVLQMIQPAYELAELKLLTLTNMAPIKNIEQQPRRL